MRKTLTRRVRRADQGAGMAGSSPPSSRGSLCRRQSQSCGNQWSWHYDGVSISVEFRQGLFDYYGCNYNRGSSLCHGSMGALCPPER